MNIGNYFCVKTNKDKTGRIVSCVLETTDGRNRIVKNREELVKEMKNNRIRVINLKYSVDLDKLNIVAISNTDTGKRADSSAKASLEKVGSKLTTKSKGAIKGVYAPIKVMIEDGLVGGYAAIYKNNVAGIQYKVFLYVGLTGDYYIKDSVEGDYYESYPKKVDAENLIYKMAQQVLL